MNVSTDDDVIQQLKDALSSHAAWSHYVVIDGAQFTDVPGQLAERKETNECLFAGELDAEVQAVAPYIVELDFVTGTLDWVFSEFLNVNGVVFISTSKEFMDIRRHLRKMALAEMPGGEMVFFRYYDPRTLKNLIPILDGEQSRKFFGSEGEVVYHVLSEKGVTTFARNNAENEES